MVYASDTFGAPPVRVACLTTSMGFASHHSPNNIHRNSSLLITYLIIINAIKLLKKKKN
jgi:hypothetical protein